MPGKKDLKIPLGSGAAEKARKAAASRKSKQKSRLDEIMGKTRPAPKKSKPQGKPTKR